MSTSRASSFLPRGRVDRAAPFLALVCVLGALASCGDSASDGPGADARPGQGNLDSGTGDDHDAAPDPPVSDDELSRATGCAGIYNPEQVLDYHVEMEAGDFDALLADQTNAIYFPARLACGDESPITVGIRASARAARSRSGSRST